MYWIVQIGWIVLNAFTVGLLLPKQTFAAPQKTVMLGSEKPCGGAAAGVFQDHTPTESLDDGRQPKAALTPKTITMIADLRGNVQHRSECGLR